MPLTAFRHIGLKIVSIGLAALLWALVSGEQVVERALRVPLEFTNVPAQLELVGDALNSVDVRVRGSAGALGRLAVGDVVAVLDLRGARDVTGQLFHLTREDVRAPLGIEVVQVTPSTIPMAFDKSDNKTVPIVPTLEGEPADGFVVSTVAVKPAMVDLVGPAGVVATMTEAITEPVSLTGKSASFVSSVSVGSPAPSVRLHQAMLARVSVIITKAPVELTIPGVPVQIRNAGRPTEVTPRLVTVYARGSREQHDVQASDFDASVDVSDLRAGQFELEVRVVPPSKLGVIRVDPRTVKVTIR